MIEPAAHRYLPGPFGPSPRSRLALRHLGCLGALCCALLAAPPPASARPAGPPTATHSRAPDVTLATRGGPVSLASLRGKVVLVDFWASWCGPCRQSFPWLTSMHQRYADQGLTIVAVNLDKRRDLADAFLGEFKPPFQIAFDPTGAAAEAFKVSAMPSSFLIGPDGTLLHTHTGFDPRKTGPIETLIRGACAR